MPIVLVVFAMLVPYLSLLSNCYCYGSHGSLWSFLNNLFFLSRYFSLFGLHYLYTRRVYMEKTVGAYVVLIKVIRKLKIKINLDVEVTYKVGMSPK